MVRKHIPTINLKQPRSNHAALKLLINYIDQLKPKQINRIKAGQRKSKSYLYSKNITRNEGFTLIEVLIAGVLMAMVMAAVSRLSLSAIANSKHQLDRVRIEAAINDNMQLMQQADSLLEYDSIKGEAEKRLACEDPANYLKEKIERKGGKYYVPVPDPKIKSDPMPINRSIDTTSAKDIAIIIYSFESPGSRKSTQQASAELLYDTKMQQATEQRILELNPNFQGKCMPTEAGK